MHHAKRTTYKMRIWTLILTFFPLLTFSQVSENKNHIDSLRFVTEMPYACEVIFDKNTPYRLSSTTVMLKTIDVSLYISNVN